MYKDVSQNQKRTELTVRINGSPHSVPMGYTVAATLLSLGKNTNRYSVVTDQQCGPYCMMGVCFECLVEIDGIPNQQGCMTEVQQGMSIRFQQGSGNVVLHRVMEQQHAS